MVDVRLKAGDGGERGELLAGHPADASVASKVPVRAVERHHLAVEGVERAHPEVAVAHHRLVGDIAVVQSLDQ